jgi:hypothetical protein
MIAGQPPGVDVSGVDAVEAAIYEGVENAEGGGRVDGPAEDVSAEDEGNDLDVGAAERSCLHVYPNLLHLAGMLRMQAMERLIFRLVHPAFVVGVAALGFVWVDVAAVFVEVDFAVLLAHVDLELAGGATALPAVVAVADAEVALAEAEGQAATRSELDVEIAAERARELQ